MLSLSLKAPDPVFWSLDMTSSFFRPEPSASLFVSWAYACQSHKTVNSRNELQDMFVPYASAYVDTTVWLLPFFKEGAHLVPQLHGKSVNNTEIASIMAGVHTVRAICMVIFPTFLRVSLSSHCLLHSRHVSRSFPPAFLSSLSLSIS
jgi:hypothetical protein